MLRSGLSLFNGPLTVDQLIELAKTTPEEKLRDILQAQNLYYLTKLEHEHLLKRNAISFDFLVHTDPLAKQYQYPRSLVGLALQNMLKHHAAPDQHPEEKKEDYDNMPRECWQRLEAMALALKPAYLEHVESMRQWYSLRSLIVKVQSAMAFDQFSQTLTSPSPR